jgi:hypothetical protein
MPPKLQGTLPYRVLSARNFSSAHEDQDQDQTGDREALEHVDDDISPAMPIEEALAAFHELKTQWAEIACRKGLLKAIEDHKVAGALNISKAVFLDDSLERALESVGRSKSESAPSLKTLVIFIDIIDYCKSAF